MIRRFPPHLVPVQQPQCLWTSSLQIDSVSTCCRRTDILNAIFFVCWPFLTNRRFLHNLCAPGERILSLPLQMKSHAWRDSLQPYSDPIRIEETSLLMLTRSAARIRNLIGVYPLSRG